MIVAVTRDISGRRTRDLSEVVGVLRAELGVRLLSVLAVGSLGRMAQEGAYDVRVEDYDVVGVVAGTTTLARKFGRRRVARAMNRLSGQMAVPVSVGLLPVESFGRLPATLFNYELKYASLVLFGPDPTGAIPAFDATRLPVVEATRLLVNRGVLVWGAVTALSGPHLDLSRSDLAFCYRKVLLALGDALLIREGTFHWAYAERARSAARCASFEEFAAADLRSRYLNAIHDKRAGKEPRLPTADHAEDFAELLALHEQVFRSVEQHRLRSDCPDWQTYAARGVSFPPGLGGSPLKRFARLLKCFGPPRGMGFYRQNAWRSDEEALTAAFPLLAYEAMRDGAVIAALLNRRVKDQLTARDVWDSYHTVWARGH